MSTFALSDLSVRDFSDLARLASAERAAHLPPSPTPEQIRQAARAFEQILTGIMVESMREAIPESGLLPELPGRDLYQQMLDQEYLRAAGDRALDLGLAEALALRWSETGGRTGGDRAGAAGETAPDRRASTPEERRTAGP